MRKFEVGIKLGGRGFEPSERGGLKSILLKLADDIRFNNSGAVTNYYGDIIGAWAITETGAEERRDGKM